VTGTLPDPTPVNRALQRVHYGVLVTLAICALVIAVDGRVHEAPPPPPDESGNHPGVALALAAVAILARRSVRPWRPDRRFVYTTLASLVCVAGLGLLGVYVGLVRDHTTAGLLYTLAGTLLGLRPPPRISVASAGESASSGDDSADRDGPPRSGRNPGDD